MALSARQAARIGRGAALRVADLTERPSVAYVPTIVAIEFCAEIDT